MPQLYPNRLSNVLNRFLLPAFILSFYASALMISATAQAERQLEREKPALQTDKRVALVIGNGDYSIARKLSNPVNDATDMTKVLSELGFEVINGVNLNLKQMTEKVREFGDKLKASGGVGLFYYAGHGVQVSGRNFLIPIEADIPREDEVDFNALNLDLVLRKMATANNGLNIMILDACRNNPFVRSWSRGDEGGGLAQIAAPTGTFIAYATSPDRTASDGAGRNGIYTAELLKLLKQPNLKIEETFKEVTKAVDRTTGGKQIPWVSSSLRGEFYFKFDKQAFEAAKAKTAQNENKETPKPDGYHQLASRAAEKYQKGDFDGAISDFNYVIELDPSQTADYREALAKVYLQRGISRHQQANYEGALADASKAIEISPKPEAVYYNIRGVVRTELKQYDEALTDLNRAIELNPNLAIIYANRGDLYKRKGDEKKAEKDYEKAKQLDANIYTPDSKPEKNPEIVAKVNTLIISANEKSNKGNFEGAIRDLTQAVNLTPKNASLYILRGNVKLLKGYIGGFAVDYPNATKLGVMRLDNDIYKTLLGETTRIIEQQPNNVTAMLNRSLLYFSRGECVKGSSDLKLALTINPHSYTANIFGFMFNYSTLDPKKMLEYLNRAIEIDPKSSFAYFLRGTIYTRLNKKKEASNDFDKLVTLSEEDSTVTTIFIKRLIEMQNRGGANTFNETMERFKCF